MASYVQTSFAGGLWSQAMQGNSARPDYRSAMNECLNGLPIDTGAWCRRSGTRTGGFTRGARAAKLRRFDFQESAPYNMEFTDGYVRFWNGANPAYTNDAQSISSISTANPAVVETTLAHGWTTGNAVRFDFGDVFCPPLQARELSITVLSTTTFSIADAITGSAIDGSTLGWATGMSGTVKRVYELATPYFGTWTNLRPVQAERQSVLLNGVTQPYVLTQELDPGPGSDPTFSLAALDFLDGPYLDPYKGSIATPSATSGNITITLSFAAYDAAKSYGIDDYATSVGIGYKSLQTGNLNNTPASSPSYWQAVSGGDPVGPSGVTASDVGRHVRLYSEPAAWVAATGYSAGNIVEYLGTYWIAIASSTGSVPGQDATKWSVSSNASLWTWGRILSASGAGTISLSEGTPFGDMTNGGGLAASFDGTNVKGSVGCSRSTSKGGVFFSAYVGKNFSASAQIIGRVAVYPSSDFGYLYLSAGPIGVQPTITLNLRGKATLPSSASDGTLLGTSGAFLNAPTVSTTIVSSDTSTAWQYVWVEIIVDSSVATYPGFPAVIQVAASQLVFSNSSTSTGAVFTMQVAGPALLTTTAVRTWRIGAYSDTTGWPKCGTYHEGRLWLSGAYGNRVDASKPNDIFNFAPTEIDGTVTAANAISYTFNSPDVNAVFWMEPDQQGIICGTQAGEWLIQATSQNLKLTPTSMQAHRVTRIKCANIEPQRTDHTIVFAQKNLHRMMEYFADVYSGKFAAPNLSLFAKHLTATGIAEIAYQQDLMPVIWVRCGDGSLIGLSYHRESLMSREGPTISAWHRHTLGSGFTMSSMVVGPSVDGLRDSLSMVTADATGRYRIEVMEDLFEETDGITDGWLLDSAVAPTSYTVSGSNLVLYGLYHLDGYTVSVTAGGLDCGDYAVTNGAVSVPLGDGITAGTGGGLLTQAYIESFSGHMPIIAGFTYTSRGQTLRPASPAEAGTRDGPAFGKQRRSQEFACQMVNTLGISFGTVFGKLKPAYFKQPNGTMYSPLSPYSGIFWSQLNDDYSFDSMLAWEITRPYPAMIASIGAFLQTQDR